MKQNSKDQYVKLTQTPIPRLILTLSVPTILSMLVTNIYNMADTAFVGLLGTSASGAVGIVFSFMAIIQAMGFMFGQGAGSIASRLLGKRDLEDASKIASTGFFGAFFAGVLIELIAFTMLDDLVIFLGSTSTIAPYAKTYITCILFAAPFMTASFLLNNLLRYEGRAVYGMVGLMGGAILNTCLDPILMFVCNLGILGAGLSTAISQIISFSILLSMFLRGKTQCKLSIQNVSRDLAVWGNICATGLPSLLRQGLASITTMLLNNEAGIYGDEAVAAMSIVSRVSMMVFSFALGIGQGFQPVGAFNFGAGKYTRVRKAYAFTATIAEFLVIVISVLVYIFAAPIVQVFRNDPVVIEIGTRALRLHCVGLLLLPPCMATEMTFQCTGHKVGASLLSSMRSGLFFIPTLLILAHTRGLAGIQEAQPLAYVLSFFPTILFAIWFLKQLPKEDKNEE